MIPTGIPTFDPIAAVAAAEAEALAQHRAGTCGESEWSCSHCEAEQSAATPERECLVCGRTVPVVNYAIERGREVGYLGRHWRPGIARTSKCRGSFGGWVGKS